MAIQEPKPATPYSKLTVEIGLYAILATLALALRLYRLGLAPLSTSEAMLSVAALRGTAIPTGASPLLYWVNAFLFSTFGAGDTLVRLLPALAGSVLVLLPALMRERIGRVGALGAAALLAISPVAIFTSRTASGDALVAAVMDGRAVGQHLLARGAEELVDGLVEELAGDVPEPVVENAEHALRPGEAPPQHCGDLAPIEWVLALDVGAGERP